MDQFMTDNVEVIATLVVAVIYEIIAHIPTKANSILQLICSIGYKLFKKCKGEK